MIGAYEGIKVVHNLAPVKATATQTGTGASRLGYAEVVMVCYVGIGLTALSGSIYWTITFEESDAVGSGFTTIGTTDLEGGLLGTVVIDEPSEDEQTLVRVYRGSKAYVRIVATLTGTNTNGTPLAFFYLLCKPNHVPVTQATEVQA